MKREIKEKKFWQKAKILKDKKENVVAMRISKTFQPEDLESTPPQIKGENWEKEFDKHFTDGGNGDVINNGCMHPSRPNGIKEFIRQLLTAEKAKWVKHYKKAKIETAKVTEWAVRKQLVEEIEKLPTGNFDSTPFKEILLQKLKNLP